MAAAGTEEEQMLIDYGFAVSVGNILESSNMSSPEKSPHGSGSDTTSQLFMNTQVKKKRNPGVSNKTRKRISETRTMKTIDLMNDGYGWRKYGQKNIHNNAYPKSYYRCTHHIEEKCEAKKWVQQESDNPPVYNTTYLGNHTCQNPRKIPQIFLPYTSSDESFDHQYYSSMSNPRFLCFESPNSNQTSHNINTNDQYINGHSSFASFSSSPVQQVDSMMFSDEPMPQQFDPMMFSDGPTPQQFDSMMFSDEATITKSCIDMEESYQQFQDEIVTYENGISTASEYPCYLPPMESPSCNFGVHDFDNMMIDYELPADFDSLMKYIG